ncbi:hypothetical protein [Streptomyces cyaneochromogenes]|uniref:hypothetical protein n=1 Tax=Streptomyces cyaneochromogenes TaxID=2496836 RepID=UPI00158987F6|nr:hypothetical protein [Streptomyces cyaneochromogenes]
MHGRLPVENAGSVPLRLFVEPYGEDFWLEPGEAVTVSPVSDGTNVQFAVTIAAELMSVWLYESGDPNRVVSESQVIDASGTRLQCGHQRHDRQIPGAFLQRPVKPSVSPDANA